MKTKKSYAMFLPLFFLMLLCWAGCEKWMASRPAKYSGTLELTEHNVGSRVPARLERLFVDEGDDVKAGQLIATLDRYDQTKRDCARLASLFQKGGANKQDVEHARLDFEDQHILAPVDGVVLIKVHESGEVLSAGQAVVVIGDRSKIWVKIYVPEGAINEVHLRQAATVHLDGIKETFRGHVIFVAPKAEFTPRNVQTPEERVTQTFAVKILLDMPAPFLRPGVAADVVMDKTD